MNAQHNTSKKGLVLSVTIYVVFMTVLILVLGTPSFGQTTTNTEPTVAFRYDGFDPDYAPAAVPTVEQLEENIIDRKMQQYDPKGLPSMEEIKKNPIEIIIGKIQLPELPKLGAIEETISSVLVHLMKDDTQDAVAHLIREDWGGSHNS